MESLSKRLSTQFQNGQGPTLMMLPHQKNLKGGVCGGNGGNNKRNFKTAIKSLIMMLNGQNRIKKQIKRVSLSVLVLGHSGVGKTSLIKAIIGEDFVGGDVSEYKPTVHDVFEKEAIINQLYVKFEFVDMAGSQNFPAMQKLYIERANIFLLVYDGGPESLTELLRLKSEIETIRNTHISELAVAVIKTRCDEIPRRRIKMKRSRHCMISTTNQNFKKHDSFSNEEQKQILIVRARSDTNSSTHSTQSRDISLIESIPGRNRKDEPRNYAHKEHVIDSEEANISHWCGTVFNVSAKEGTNIAKVDEYLLSEGSFADTISSNSSEKSGSKAFDRQSKNRISGRYIYRGRRRSKSIILNR